MKHCYGISYDQRGNVVFEGYWRENHAMNDIHYKNETDNYQIEFCNSRKRQTNLVFPISYLTNNLLSISY